MYQGLTVYVPVVETLPLKMRATLNSLQNKTKRGRFWPNNRKMLLLFSAPIK